MSAQKAYPTLISKEFRQNIVLYIFPFLIAFIVFILAQKNHHLIPESFAIKLAIAISVAIALAYGIQSFDLEEKGQTRDFLIVKPISVRQIIGIKYLTGFGMCFSGGLIWLLVLAPRIIQWPSLVDLRGFMFLAIILLELIVYTISFLFGALIKGPVKIIGAFFGASITVLVFFGFWLELIKFLTWENVQELWSYILLFILTTIEIVILYQIISHLTQINLQNQSFPARKKTLIILLSAFLVFPITFWGINSINPPVITPYTPLSMLLSNDTAFIAYQGAKSPVKNLYAVVDYSGRLGLLESGKTPVAVFQSPSKLKNPFQDIIWSPDGSKIAFNDNKNIYVFSVSDKKLIVSFTGKYAMWSRDSDRLLIGSVVGSNLLNTPQGKLKQNIIQLSLADFKLKTVLNMGQLKSIGLGFCWDSANQTILSIDPFWRFSLINLKNGSVQFLNLPKKGKEKMGIFLVRIVPPSKNKTDALCQVFSTNQKHDYNIDLYRFSLINHSIIHQSSLKKVTYSDFFPISQGTEALYSNVPGVYHNIKLPKGVE